MIQLGSRHGYSLDPHIHTDTDPEKAYHIYNFVCWGRLPGGGFSWSAQSIMKKQTEKIRWWTKLAAREHNTKVPSLSICIDGEQGVAGDTKRRVEAQKRENGGEIGGSSIRNARFIVVCVHKQRSLNTLFIITITSTYYLHKVHSNLLLTFNTEGAKMGWYGGRISSERSSTWVSTCASTNIYSNCAESCSIEQEKEDQQVLRLWNQLST